MSYEGSVEYLCTKGHYSARDAYEDDLVECPLCSAAMAYSHNVDHTNGEVDDDPATLPAETLETGHEDVWNTDHYGTRYALQRTLFAPAPESAWRVLRPEHST